MIKKYVFLISVFAFSVIYLGVVHAVVSDDAKGQSNKLRESGKPNQLREQICQRTQSKVNERWTKYYDQRMNRVENMGKGIVTLQRRVEFYKGKGLDTVKLESDLDTLQNMIDSYKTSFATFLDELEDAKTLPCANYDASFLPELKQARNSWAGVKKASADIKAFYQSTIKPDLQALSAQLDDKVTETEE